jgi:hypothetical protein
VAAGLGHDGDQALPHLIGEVLQLLAGQLLDVVRTVDRLEQRHGQFGLVTM